MTIADRAQVQPAFTGAKVGNIRHPHSVELTSRAARIELEILDLNRHAASGQLESVARLLMRSEAISSGHALTSLVRTSATLLVSGRDCAAFSKTSWASFSSRLRWKRCSVASGDQQAG